MLGVLLLHQPLSCPSRRFRIAVVAVDKDRGDCAFGQQRLGEDEPLVATLSGEFVCYFSRGDYRMMRRLTDEARHVDRK